MTSPIFRHLTTNDYTTMPWQNGGGQTTELAKSSPDKDGRFVWRVSIAQVAKSGDFSVFQGYDRHMMMIKGNGMRLVVPEAEDIWIKQTHTPAFFSGDWKVSGQLTNGPLQNFNVIVDHRQATACLTVCRAADLAQRQAPMTSHITIIHNLSSTPITLGQQASRCWQLAGSDTLKIENPTVEPITLRSLEPASRSKLAHVEISIVD